ncbi:4a-hydroxytetrahydrobiopterin dehydratase [Williamsia maris]|uniref:Putative pterin-4-alpha-carbinolamine dehydratase n=2 Tax=Williamsia maris TaxID=72806 RepID=A0ABT1HHQ6_9NOCA|nr:4a-hydroxytetrahydrobiopterin dehydratase [Williamsia maris]
MGFMTASHDKSGDELLSADRISAVAAVLPEWEFGDRVIRRDFSAPTFLDGIAFVGRIATEAENRDHHPDIDIRWRTVTIALSTHSAGGLTELDVALAGAIDDLFHEMFDAVED